MRLKTNVLALEPKRKDIFIRKEWDFKLQLDKTALQCFFILAGNRQPFSIERWIHDALISVYHRQMLDINNIGFMYLDKLRRKAQNIHRINGRAHRTCVFCMLGTIVMTIVFWCIPDTVSPWVMAVPFMLIAFFIYGPQALLGIAMSNQATKEASATANGILGVFGYASTLISGVGLGFIADRYGWNSIYAVILVFAVLGLLTLTTIWKAAPDGYGAAKKFTAEYERNSSR